MNQNSSQQERAGPSFSVPKGKDRAEKLPQGEFDVSYRLFENRFFRKEAEHAHN